jgi:TRAP-type C4-dicarboxylate transport system permease small subunit
VRAVIAAYNRLVVALAILAGASIALAFVLIVMDVSVRAAGQRPPAFTSAVVEYILLYFTLFAAPYLVRQKGHVCIDAVLARLTGHPRWVAEKLAYLVCVVTCAVFAVVGFQLALEAIAAGSIEERSIDVPSWVDYSPVGPVFLLVAIEFTRYLLGFDSLYRDRTTGADSL